jgi:hypothetical protein
VVGCVSAEHSFPELRLSTEKKKSNRFNAKVMAMKRVINLYVLHGRKKYGKA